MNLNKDDCMGEGEGGESVRSEGRWGFI